MPGILEIMYDESLEDTGLNDGVRRWQKESVKQSKTQESFWGISDKQDIEKVLWIALKCNRRRKGNSMLIWTERRKKWGTYRVPGLPGNWGSDCRRPEEQPFPFPSSRGLQRCYLRLCPLGRWLLITTGCLYEQPSGVKFTALRISTLCWAELACAQAPWVSGAAGQASPAAPRDGLGGSSPLLSSGAGAWGGLSLALQAWGELTGQQNSLEQVLERVRPVRCAAKPRKWLLQRPMQKKTEELNQGIELRGGKDNCGPGFTYGIAGRMETEAPAASPWWGGWKSSTPSVALDPVHSERLLSLPLC